VQDDQNRTDANDASISAQNRAPSLLSKQFLITVGLLAPPVSPMPILGVCRRPQMARSSASRVAHRITEGKHLPSATTIRSSPDYGQASHPAISIGKDRRKADAVLAPD